MGARTDAVMEVLTDDRLEPHLYLAGQLALLAVVAALLFWLEPLVRGG